MSLEPRIGTLFCGAEGLEGSVGSMDVDAFRGDVGEVDVALQVRGRALGELESPVQFLGGTEW